MADPSIVNPGPAATRNVVRESRQNQNDVTQNRPIADPQNQKAAWQFHYDKTARIVIGTITDTCALAHIYRVQFEKALAPIPCVVAPHTSHSVSGVRDLRTLQAGSMVIVVVHEQLAFGLILGTVPLFHSRTSKDTLEDMITQASRNRVDEGHKKPLTMPHHGSIPDLHAGRPFDSTMSGEWGYISATGLRVYVDDFMTQLGNGEGCGITSFYHDDLLRIAAYNLQFWTAGGEREAFNDQDEFFDKQGWTAYPWEQLGIFERKDPRKENTPEEWQLGSQKPWYSHWEPQNDNQQPWHRANLVHGYLGQGRKEYHQTWPKDKPNLNLYYEQPKMIYMGLHDDTVSMTGERSISSAKRISICKRAAIIVPKRVQRPEQPVSGDTEKNYKFSSLLGSGPEHKITSDIAVNADHPQLQRAAGILDMHSYLYNYANFMGFYWHSKDWYVPEEKDLTHVDGKTFLKIPFKDLASKQYLDPPEPVEWDIDHRLTGQQFWQNECGVDFLEDGGVVLYGGSGEEIRLVAGQVVISAPGDVWLKAGRSLVQWAGFDAITRAKNSVDITATQHDIRVGAGQHVQIGAGLGSDKMGAVMIESRGEGATYNYKEGGEAVQSNGIQLKSRKAEIVNWAQSIYLRTGGGNVEKGEIVLDAAKGDNNITFVCANHYNYVGLNGGVYHFFGQAGDVKKANEFTRNFTMLCSYTGINGPAVIVGNITNKGWIATAQGHIVTEFADQSAGLVGTLRGKGLQDVFNATQQIQDIAEKVQPTVAKDLWKNKIKPALYDAGKPGNDTTIREAEFSLRAVSEYKTTDFELYEDRWQQLGRLWNTATATWTETTLTCECGLRAPYPGKEKFDEKTYMQQNLTMFSAEQQRAEDRGEQPSLVSAYSDPKYAKPTPVPLQKYLVIS